MVQGSIPIEEILKMISMLVSIFIGFMVINKQIKKSNREYVDSKLENVNTQIIDIKEDIKENKRTNEREHDAIKEEFLSQVNMIFEWIKSKSK